MWAKSSEKSISQIPENERKEKKDKNRTFKKQKKKYSMVDVVQS